MFIVYILYSNNLNKYYVGSTENLPKRLEEHNSGRGNFTSKGTPWNLITTIEFATRSLAVQKELQIKSRGIRRFLADNDLL